MDRDRHVTEYLVATDSVSDHGRSVRRLDQRHIDDRSMFAPRTVAWAIHVSSLINGLPQEVN